MYFTYPKNGICKNIIPGKWVFKAPQVCKMAENQCKGYFADTSIQSKTCYKTYLPV